MRMSFDSYLKIESLSDSFEKIRSDVKITHKNIEEIYCGEEITFGECGGYILKEIPEQRLKSCEELVNKLKKTVEEFVIPVRKVDYEDDDYLIFRMDCDAIDGYEDQKPNDSEMCFHYDNVLEMTVENLLITLEDYVLPPSPVSVTQCDQNRNTVNIKNIHDAISLAQQRLDALAGAQGKVDRTKYPFSPVRGLQEGAHTNAILIDDQRPYALADAQGKIEKPKSPLGSDKGFQKRLNTNADVGIVGFFAGNKMDTRKARDYFPMEPTDSGQVDPSDMSFSLVFKWP
ncbi:MAG TPA: hypothetical protein DCL40_03915 [Coxiellaceae bacterium]|nr:hypothetical protein [Coxiellaceae bacterium]